MSKRISGIAKTLIQSRINVKVIAPLARSCKVVNPEFGAEDILVERLDLRRFSGAGSQMSKGLHWLLFTIFASIKTCREFLKSRCLVQYQTVYSAGPAMFVKLLGAKVVGDDFVLANPATDAFLLKKTDLIVTPSVRAFRLSEQLGRRALYVPNGVDNPMKRNVSSSPDPNILFVGSFNFDQNLKAIESIFKIAATLEGDGLKFRILIVGGPLNHVLGFLDRDVVRNRIVQFLGNVSFPRLSQLYASSYIGLLPFFEDIPLLGGQRTKALEFFANGLVVVSGAEGVRGVAGIESEKHFFLVDSLEMMCKTIRVCLVSPKRCLAIAQAGQKYVSETYSWTRLTKDYIEMIQKVGTEGE